MKKRAEWRDVERKLKERQEKVLDRWKNNRNTKRIKVNEDDVLKVISDWTGVPLSRMEKTEAQRLLGLEKDYRPRLLVKIMPERLYQKHFVEVELI